VYLDEVDAALVQKADGAPCLGRTPNHETIRGAGFVAVHERAGSPDPRTGNVVVLDSSAKPIDDRQIATHIARTRHTRGQHQRCREITRQCEMHVHIPQARDEELAATVDLVSSRGN
jgi:hypothetical protein